MTVNGILQILVYCCLILLAAKPIGAYMARVFAGERTFLSPVLGPIERITYRLCGVDPAHEMRWTTYAGAVLAFSAVGFALSYALLRLQGLLPLNPQGFGTKEMTPDLALNTAASFMTNTNWQSYVPETTISYFSNMVALAIHNWMSAAAGIAIAIAVARGFASRKRPAAGSDAPVHGLGNFWADVTRATLYVLLPLSLVLSMAFVWQGVPQNFDPYTQATTLEGAQQSIAQGPMASQESIKLLGTNGGGFMNANSSHPYANPTPLSNLLQMVAIFLIPAGLTVTFGRIVGDARQGWVLFAAMSVLFVAGAFVAYGAEAGANPNVAALGVQTVADGTQPGGNMEGKEARLGMAPSALFAAITTGASCGAVNSMHDSYTPIGGLVPLANMMTGEVIFGGVGAGLYGILMYAVLGVLVAGLMVGRTPEYLGKKIERFEVKMAMLAALAMAVSILGLAAIGATLDLPSDKAKAAAALNRVGTTDTYYGATYNNVNNSGPHGFSEILYAYTSATANNGSAFAGLTANTPVWNVTLAVAMLFGRFLMIIPLLAIAGSLARKTPVPVSAGTMPTSGGTFVVLLVGTIVLIGALTYLPALALGPVVEHLQMNGGRLW